MGNPELIQTVDELSTELAMRQKRAYLAFDADAKLIFSGGELSHYGLGKLTEGGPAIDRLRFLHGLVPLETADYQNIPSVSIGDHPNCAVHLFKRESNTWVVLLDPIHLDEKSIHEVRIAADDQGAMMGKFLGKEISERLSKGINSINENGERREVSVLFADLRGFTTFCDTNNTVEIFPLLNRFLGAMIKPVIDNNGVIDKIIGDAVMAVFGLSADEDPNYKARAIKASKEMIEGVNQITSGSKHSASVPGIGVGIASGDVVVGVLGNDRRRSFSVIGHRVNLAARLESRARPGELLIDVATWEGLADGQQDFELTDLWLKGLTRPVPTMSYYDPPNTPLGAVPSHNSSGP